ncbi:XNP, partial [Symbiodinium microadriaticum]
PDIVVLDEAHYLKQTSSQIFSVIDSIRTKRRIALTGSPMQNNLRELWSMIEFVKAGHLNSYKMFEKRFKIPIE